VFCTLFRGREEESDPGAYLSADYRGNLRRMHDDFTRSTGLHLRAGTEPEMMWLRLNFQFDRAEATADRLTTHRQICRQVGREMGAFPCFMPKPFMGVSANGCHHRRRSARRWRHWPPTR